MAPNSNQPASYPSAAAWPHAGVGEAARLRGVRSVGSNRAHKPCRRRRAALAVPVHDMQPRAACQVERDCVIVRIRSQRRSGQGTQASPSPAPTSRGIAIAPVFARAASRGRGASACGLVAFSAGRQLHASRQRLVIASAPADLQQGRARIPLTTGRPTMFAARGRVDREARTAPGGRSSECHADEPTETALRPRDAGARPPTRVQDLATTRLN